MSFVFPLVKLARMIGGSLTRSGIENLEVRGLTASDKGASPGGLFVAVPGTKIDGHQFIRAAFERGCVAAVVSDSAMLDGRPGIQVRDTRVALSKLAALFSGNPSQDLKVIGITGTNGKTTTHWVLYHVLNQLDLACLRIGTVGVRCELGIDAPGNLTTPDPIEVQSFMAKAKSLGAKSCVMEMSSHALHQHRVEDVELDAAVFTNLTRDHLDYHQEMESYFSAKRRMFELMANGSKACRAAVVNVDTQYGLRLQKDAVAWGLNDYGFGRADGARVRISGYSQTASGSTLELAWDGRSYVITSSFIGAHNAENLAGVFASAVALGCDGTMVAEAMCRAPQVPGRLERVGEGEVAVFVDYAHTPDALERVLVCLRDVTKGRLRVLFGCGGDRDKGKRPQMAEIAVRLADQVTVTSDNPRTEDPQRIIDDVLACGAGEKIRCSGLIEADRKIAIRKTIEAAAPGDVVLLAGKGHEDYQIIGVERVPFSDQEEARASLEKKMMAEA